jgi:hypothetical protein
MNLVYVRSRSTLNTLLRELETFSEKKITGREILRILKGK